MPFRSRAQWRWGFATGQSFAHRWAHETPGGPGARYRALPYHVSKKGKGGKGSRSRKAGFVHTMR